MQSSTFSFQNIRQRKISYTIPMLHSCEPEAWTSHHMLLISIARLFFLFVSILDGFSFHWHGYYFSYQSMDLNCVQFACIAFVYFFNANLVLSAAVRTESDE